MEPKVSDGLWISGETRGGLRVMACVLGTREGGCAVAYMASVCTVGSMAIGRRSSIGKSSYVGGWDKVSVSVGCLIAFLLYIW
jgi:hypothetical protein